MVQEVADQADQVGLGVQEGPGVEGPGVQEVLEQQDREEEEQQRLVQEEEERYLQGHCHKLKEQLVIVWLPFVWAEERRRGDQRGHRGRERWS